MGLSAPSARERREGRLESGGDALSLLADRSRHLSEGRAPISPTEVSSLAESVSSSKVGGACARPDVLCSPTACSVSFRSFFRCRSGGRSASSVRVAGAATLSSSSSSSSSPSTGRLAMLAFKRLLAFPLFSLAATSSLACSNYQCRQTQRPRIQPYTLNSSSHMMAI